jgi:hypothetical protein
MPKYNSEEAVRLVECLAINGENPQIKLAKLARQKHVSYDKLRHRIRGVPDQHTNGGHNKRLNSTQDDGLKRYLSYLIRIGQPATKAGICGAANRILFKCGDQG